MEGHFQELRKKKQKNKRHREKDRRNKKKEKEKIERFLILMKMAIGRFLLTKILIN